jgi:hypothetical protein
MITANQKTKKNPQSIILALVITVFIIFSSVFLMKSISVETLEDSIKIKGLYETEVQYKDIEEIKEIDSMPLWGLKTNGINLGFMNIGMFTYKELGKVRLFELKKEKPYVLIVSKTEKILLGLGKVKNEEIYRIVEEKIKNIQK